MKKRKLKKKVVILIILIVVLILCITGFILYKTLSKNQVTEDKVIDSIEEYGYVLEDDQPKIYQDLFKELSKVLQAENVDEEEYARLISQMFSIDFYNLENKVSKNDVGGTMFISTDYVDNFTLKASDTVYKYIEHNLYNDRDQNLPVVTSSSVNKLENVTYEYKSINDDNAYEVTVNLEYEEDLGYPTEIVLTLIHNDKKLEICEME